MAARVDEPAFGDETGQFTATAVVRRLAGDRWRARPDITFPPSRGPYDDTWPDGAGMLEIGVGWLWLTPGRRARDPRRPLKTPQRASSTAEKSA